MSALLTFSRINIIRSIFFLFIIIGITLTVVPEIASASSLPQGIIDSRSCGIFQSQIRAFGSGMMQGKVPIEVSKQRLSSVNTSENCAVIQWETSVPATSQIIYGELAKEPVSINLSKDYFGYQSATPQNNSGLAKHTAILKFLEPGKTYAYRIVTKAYPNAIPSISDPIIISMKLSSAPSSISPKTENNSVQNAKNTEKNSISQSPNVQTKKVVSIINNKTTVKVASTLVSENSIVDSLYSTVGLQTTNQIASSAAKSKLDVQKARSVATAVAVLDKNSNENTLVQQLSGVLSKKEINGKASNEDVSNGLATKGKGAQKNYYILPFLAVLVVLVFFFKKHIVSAFRFTVEGYLLYWLAGASLLTVFSAMFAYYYIALIGIAIFLALLAVYLLQTVSDDETEEKQPKLLEMPIVKNDVKKKEDIKIENKTENIDKKPF